MSYPVNVYEQVRQTIADRRRKAEDDAQARADAFYAESPEARQAAAEMRRSAYAVVRAIGASEDAQAIVESMMRRNLAAQARLRQILTDRGLPENYLDPRYTCTICGDTGVRDGKLCECFRALLRRTAYEALCRESPMQLSRFEDFDLSYYKDDPNALELMERNYAFCRNYADGFDLNSSSILMTGETGLGKTHLSLAIAGAVVEKGFGVVYGSAQKLFARMEREKFGKSDQPDGTTEAMLETCDLLILDDLGAEYATQLSKAQLGSLIDTRMLSGKPTIISTNLSIRQLEERYSRRIASRIIGEYAILMFAGRDIRQLRK